MMEPIGVGIVGISPERGWASTAHVPALQALSGFALKAICTSKPESAERAAAAFGVPGYSDIGAMLERSDVSLVVVTVRVPHHREILLPIIAAGKNVLCEWPLARTLAEARELTDAAESAGIGNFVGLQARASPVVEHVRALIAEGYVGDVLSTTLVGSGNYWGDRVSEDDVYILDRDNGATMLTIPFGHTIDGVCHCLGQFAEFSALTETKRRNVTVVETGATRLMTAEDQILVQGRLTSGALISAHYRGGTSLGTNLLWEINGTRGDLVVSGNGGSMQIGRLKLHGGRLGEKLHELPLPENIGGFPAGLQQPAINVARAYSAIGDALRGGGASDGLGAPRFRDALMRHEMLVGVQQAAAEGVQHGPDSATRRD